MAEILNFSDYKKASRDNLVWVEYDKNGQATGVTLVYDAVIDDEYEIGETVTDMATGVYRKLEHAKN